MSTVLLILATVALIAQPAASNAAAGADPGVCLALSGGGARGLAHIGVLQALESEDVNVRCIAGTSMGALVGGLYAAGYSPTRMQEIVRSLEWRRVFSGRPERSLVPLALRVDEMPAVLRLPLNGRRLRLPVARDSDYRINRLLFRLLAEPGFRMGPDFDRLRVPLRTVATDLESGERVVLAEGSLPRAVRASLSTPVNLVPVTIAGRVLVDGGLVDNLPTDVAREMGAGPVLAVDVRSPALKPKPSDSFVDTTAVVVDLLMRARNEGTFSAADAEIDLRPALAGIRPTDYRRHEDAMAIGYREGRRGAAQARTLLGEEVPAAARGERPAPGPALEGSRVDEVAVRGADHVRHSVVTRALGLAPGNPFAMERVLRGMDAVYATELFQSVWLDVTPSAKEGATVTVEVQEAPRVVLEAGGGYDEGDNAWGFLRLRNRNLFGRGERIDTTGIAGDSEVGVFSAVTAERPLGLPVGMFVRGYWLEDKPRVFRAHDSIGRAEFDRRAVSAGLQYHLGAAGLLRVGATAGVVYTRERAGVPFAAGQDDLGLVLGEAAWDTLDDRALPMEGLAAAVSAEHSVSGLGSDRSYWRTLARLQAAASPGRRLLARGQVLAATSGGDLPVSEQFRVGGPLWMPGFHREELWGGHALAGSLTAGVAVHHNLRALVRVGAGNVWESRQSASLGDLEGGFGLGLEMPTPAGPVTLDWGRRFDGVSRFYVSLGLPREQSLIR
jgi:NTE family protein